MLWKATIPFISSSVTCNIPSSYIWSWGSTLVLRFVFAVIQSPIPVQPLQHVRLPCPSLSPEVYSSSGPLSWWCHPTISSSAAPFSLCLQFFPASGFFFFFFFPNESVLHIRWPKYWRFNFSISPSKEHSGLISFRIDWLNLLAVQGILKSLL